MSAGRIDFHLHLLPGVDDGARTLKDTREMASILQDLGYVKALTTSHIHPTLWSTRSRVSGAFETAVNELRAGGFSLELTMGAEHYFDETLLDLIQSKEICLIGKGNFFLVEMPKTEIPMGLWDILFRIQRAGYFPIIAHPERYSEVQKNPSYIEGFMDRGCPLQLDLGSLSDEYGRASRKAAEKLLDMGAYSVAGSDMHKPEGGLKYMKEALKKLEKIIGERGAEKLTAINPARILEGEDPIPV